MRYPPRYRAVSAATGVPVILLATLHNRESDANFNTYLGNGEPLNRVTRLVPKGRGPFPSWEAGAKDALHIDRLDEVKDWSWAKALYYGELWNGFGPRNHGIYTGYLWAGTNHYTRGKYVADGVWDPGHVDEQLGIVPLMKRLAELDASLDLPGPEASPAAALPNFLLSPVSIQQALNALGFGPLVEDGNIGRLTRAAIRAFQRAHNLDPDGIVGPLTREAMKQPRGN